MDAYKLEIGRIVEMIVDFIYLNMEGAIDAFSNTLLVPIEATQFILLKTPPVVLIILTALIVWRRMGISKAGVSVLAFILLLMMDYWDQSMRTIAITACATFYCLLIGIPLGVLAGENKRLNSILLPALAWMQTTPSFVYLIAIVIIFGMGVVPGIIATVIFSLPSSIRLTALGIRGVDKTMIEAGSAVGCNRWQLVWRIKIPQAMPAILTGVNQTIMMALSMIVIASLIGAPGLGVTILVSLGSVEIGKGINAGICVILIAYILDKMTDENKTRNRT